MTQSINPISKIAIWGPSGTGKTMLINAFARKISLLSQEDKDFYYKLISTDTGMMIDPTDSFFPAPTYRIMDNTYIFSRIPIRKEPKFLISASEHQIVIHDTRGEDTVTLSSTDYATEGIISYSDMIIITIDPTRLLPRYNMYNEQKEDQIQSINNLLYFLRSKNKFETSIAICITKMDILPSEFQILQAEELFSSLVKDNHFSKSINRLGFSRVGYFKSSSIGYLRDNAGKTVSNYYQETNSLINMDKWMPVGVEEPFFWFFEMVERQRLEKSLTQLQSFFFKKDRLSQYVGYPKSRSG